MNTKMLDLMKESAFMFPNNAHKENKELAKALCKAHKKAFELIMNDVEQAVVKNKDYAKILIKEIDDVVRSCVKYSEAWHWAIANTREYTVKNMQRFGYEAEIKDIFTVEGYVSHLTLEWERGKHHDYSEEG